MMMDPVFDPFECLLANDALPASSDDFYFNDPKPSDQLNFDGSPTSPSVDLLFNNPESNFDIDMFQKFLDQLMSSDAPVLDEMPTFEAEPATREMGTDPMIDVQPPIIHSTQPIRTIPTASLNQFGNTPIIIIQAGAKNPNTSNFILTAPTSFQTVESSEDLPEHFEQMTPSPSNDSLDEGNSSPDTNAHEPNQNSMITDLNRLPKSGPLVLTDEELKLIKQEKYPIPTKLPLSKSEEKMLKRIQRKIKNKISAQESRRKKKEYVEELEKRIALYMDENNALKEKMVTMEKSQKSMAKERDLLRSMVGKGTTAAPSTALMVFALFFAVLFGAWSPLNNNSAITDQPLSRELGLVSSMSSNGNSIFNQPEKSHSSGVKDNYRSRVLLSIDEQDHQHGPYLPYSQKSKSSGQAAAPGYTYSRTVEKYMNKRIRSQDNSLKRSFDDDSFDEMQGVKRRTYSYPHENVMIIEETPDVVENENKSVKIIRVERTTPALGNDTLKLAQRTANE